MTCNALPKLVMNLAMTLLALCALPHYTIGQNFDSLQNVISNMPEGEAKVDALHDFINTKMLKDNSYDRALMETAMQLATELNYETGIARNKLLRGHMFVLHGELDSAQLYLLSALSTFEKNNDEPNLATTFHRLAHLQIVRSNFDLSQDYINKALALESHLKDQKLVGTTYNNQAAILIRKGWSMTEEDQKEERVAIFKEAIPYLKTAIDHLQEAGYEDGLAVCYVNLGLINMELGNYTPSLQFIRQSLNYFVKNSDAALSTVYGYMGDAHEHIGNYDSALFWSKRALKKAISFNQNLEIRTSYRRLINISEKRGDLRQALRYHDQYDSISGIILNEQKQATIDELQIKYESEKRDKEIMSKQQVIDEQRTIMYTAVLICIVLFVLAYAVYLKRVKIERLNEELKEKTDKLEETSFKVTKKNAELNDSMQQQSNLMSVVVHDLRSPLNNIIGLLQLMDMGGKLNKEQQEAYDKILQVTNDGLSLIEDISSINRLRLKTKPKIKPVDFDKMITDLVSMHKPSADAKRIELNLNSPEVPLEEIQTDRLMVARIMDNLISNAIKFSPFERVVNVDYTVHNEILEIHVVDQGPGISEADQKQAFQRFTKLSARPTAGESSNGLGLFIVKNLVERLDGTVRIESQLDKGAKFVVTLPIKR